MNTSKWLILLSLLVTTTSHAVPQNTVQQEIQHLLQFVKSTDCQYQRNGTSHTGVEAVKHIQKKYDYFLDDIKTAEDFIKYSATKSKMSGNKYQVLCENQKAIYSQDWLLQALQVYRGRLLKE